MLRRILIIMFIIASLIISTTAYADEDDPETVIVPDVTGLVTPQAAAALNEAGLRLGAQNVVTWTAESGLPQGSISGQSIEPGTEVEFGTAVDVNVLREANVLLIYDDINITLVNQSAGPIILGQLVFNSLDGNTGTTFVGSRWAETVDSGNCVQVWSVGAQGARSVPECGSTRWLTTNNPEEHFWTGSNNATEFLVTQNGIQRAICPVSASGRCEFHVEVAGAVQEVTEYVYYAYTTDRFMIINQSEDQWMTLSGLTINDLRGGQFAPAAPDTYDQQDDILGNTEQLAPGQCLFLANRTGAGPLASCNVIAAQVYDVDYVFWLEPFTYTSLTDGVLRGCPGADSERMTLCILPR